MKAIARAALAVALTILGLAPRISARLVARGAVQTSVSGREPTSTKRYPISKVVTLLRDMQKQLEKEADEDEDVYEKLQCWCKVNNKDKEQAIKDAQAREDELITLIETSAADSARLQEEIKNHKEDLAKSKQSLDTATSLRDKQAAEFHGEEKDMIQSITALDSAIVVLSRHFQGTALLDAGVLRSTVEAVRAQLKRHRSLLWGTVAPKARRDLAVALQQVGQSPTFKQPYQPQSSEIFGIIKQMKETFQTNLAQTQKEEMANAKAYEALKAAKAEEIKATEAAIEMKRVQLSEADEKNAHAKADLEDLRNSLSTDDNFLMDVKTRCANSEKEWELRSKMRSEEISAVTETISILSADQARDAFSRTFNGPTAVFLQEAAASHRGRRDSRGDAAAKVLTVAASKVKDPKLVALAIAARLDPLTRVKQSIDTLIGELVEEKKLEITQKDSCIERQHNNVMLTEQHQRDRSDLESKTSNLKTTISEIKATIDTSNAEIAEYTLQIKRRGEDRELENRDFQNVIADQKETQVLLQKALGVLKKVYAAKEGVQAVSLLQAGEDPGEDSETTLAGKPPPAGFKEYGKNRNTGGVLALVEQIVRDAAAMEKEAINDEQMAQKDYETFVKDTNKSIQTLQQGLVNMAEAKSKAEQDLITAEEDLKAAIAELQTLSNGAGALKMECDFLLRNFDIRQESRDQEVEALQQAKAILSGMKLED